MTATMVLRALAVLCLLLGGPVFAAVLEAGPGLAFPTLSAAVAAAKDGDTIRIAPGVYEDCATIRQNNLTLEGPGAELTRKTCGGKAILVVTGKNVEIRGLTLSYAKVPDRNGAGVRAESGPLLLENIRFLNNENGLLTANGPDIEVRVKNATFIGNGECRPVCAHGIYAGHIASLIVESSNFLAQREGHHIKSRANRTEVTGSKIDDGFGGTASYLIDIPNGGTVRIENNRLRKGPSSSNSTAIALGAETAANPTQEVAVRDNVFVNDSPRLATFVKLFSGASPTLTGNQLTGAVTPFATAR